MTKLASPESAARRACRASGLPDESLVSLHQHATSVFLLPAAGIVVRVSPASQKKRLETAVALTRWLTARRFPATEPADVPQPVEHDGHVVTFWKHYPQPSTGVPAAGHLGALLRKLHKLPQPPVQLPEYQPLTSLQTTLANSSSLQRDEREWLRIRSDELLDSYGQLTFLLAPGFIHGDAYPGNTLWDGSKPRLGDWDEAAVGPREIDLANTYQGVRFGRTQAELDDFSDQYGYDIRHWPGLSVLCGIRDLHTLGSYIRRADRGDETAAVQLSYRLETLRNDDTDARWGAA